MSVFLKYLVLVALAMNVSAYGSEESSSAPVELTTSYYYDPAGTLRIEDVTALPHTEFQALQEHNSNFGFQAGHLWLKIVLNASQSMVRYLSFNHGYLSRVELYWPQGSGHIQRISGAAVAPAKRELNERRPTFVLDIVQGPTVFYVRIASDFYLNVGFELLEEAAYQEQPRENSFYSLIYGLLLTMVLFNFFFILASGMTIYRGYLYFGITILFYFMIAHGNLDLFCPLPYSFSWSSICNSVAGLAALSLFQHQRYILSTRTNMPRLDRCFAIGLAGISFGMLTPVPQLRYLAGIVGDYSILYAVLLSLAIGVVGIKRKISGAIAFMVGFGILGFALFLFQLQLLGFIPVDSRSDLFFELGVSGQMLAMALGIGLSLQKTIREKIKVSQLAQLNKLKAESAKTMLSLLSHDLNNPLSVIAGTASLMKNRYGSDTKDHQMWDMVAKAAQQEHEILVSARKLIEIDSINFHLRPTTIQAEDLHDQIMFIFKERLVAKNISFVSNLKDNPLSFTSDRSILFSNVIGNIMSNAIKFSSPGGVIRLELKEQEGQIVIAVSDEGIGMSQQILRQFNGEELLTQTFKRPGTSGESGSGFGLAIVKKTTEELQGTMIISSKEATELDPTHGTTVTITLPKTLAKTHQIA